MFLDVYMGGKISGPTSLADWRCFVSISSDTAHILVHEPRSFFPRTNEQGSHDM